MSKYQYRISLEDGNTVESSTPYREKTHHLETVLPVNDEGARKICEALNMKFLSRESPYDIKAECTASTSSFFWAGGQAA